MVAEKNFGGGDGMQVQVDTRDNTTLITDRSLEIIQRTNRLQEKAQGVLHRDMSWVNCLCVLTGNRPFY